jgi:hypothetical protein
MPITADALTGPKYRLSNDAGLVTLSRNSSPGRSAGIAARMAADGPSGRRAARRPKARRRCGRCASDAHLLRRDRAHALEQRNARRQVAALRSQRGSIWRQRGQDDAAHGQRTWQRAGPMVERIDAIPADRHTVGRVVDQARQRMHEGRPGQRSEAAGGQAREHDASAQT